MQFRAILLVAAGVVALVLVVFGLVAFAGRDSGASLPEADLARIRAQGVAPDLIYLVDVPGYTLAEQSLGVINDEGFGAIYSSSEGRTVELRVDRGAFDDAVCADMPVHNVVDAPVTCDRDDVGWYRTAGDRHEYIVVRGDHFIRLNGMATEVTRETLKAAVAGARQITGDVTEAPEPPRTPVERGDLPTVGDGAPNNEVGPGG
ncbi:hypothetical protein [Planotetraspora kaengkrachanensis]|uniref:Membrane protein n=1 Tax=Planotetraspora kaengkrachanensis TaxID=575193 RepID=A0A8J3PY68_9ACTN|nr:hypothetical protein [Planotetraspora kaengkrachanensis]GIG83312.1 membrane protein [Planotetraspora kaengkrachanensis]